MRKNSTDLASAGTDFELSQLCLGLLSHVVSTERLNQAMKDELENQEENGKNIRTPSGGENSLDDLRKWKTEEHVQLEQGASTGEESFKRHVSVFVHPFHFLNAKLQNTFLTPPAPLLCHIQRLARSAHTLPPKVSDMANMAAVSAAAATSSILSSSPCILVQPLCESHGTLQVTREAITFRPSPTSEKQSIWDGEYAVNTRRDPYCANELLFHRTSFSTQSAASISFVFIYMLLTIPVLPMLSPPVLDL